MAFSFVSAAANKATLLWKLETREIRDKFSSKPLNICENMNWNLDGIKKLKIPENPA